MKVLPLLNLVFATSDGKNLHAHIYLFGRNVLNFSDSKLVNLYNHATRLNAPHSIFVNTAALRLLSYQQLESLFTAIAKNNSVKRLIFYAKELHRFTESQLAVMCRPLSECSSLREVQFCDNHLSQLSDIQWFIIFNHLSYISNLNCIKLSHNDLRGLPHQQLSSMWRLLSKSGSLRAIHIDRTGLQEYNLQGLQASNSLLEIHGVSLNPQGSLAAKLSQNRHGYFMPGAALQQVFQQRLAMQIGPMLYQIQAYLDDGPRFTFHKVQQRINPSVSPN